jgi:molybdate transport system ATP-binding protein/molybdate/tungstate transport system ATP-binding protein
MQRDDGAMNRTMLEVEGLSKRLGEFEISDVSFAVDRGEYFVLLGASGTGKTVLLETLTGIIRPDAGKIVLAGRDITRERMQRRKIGIVFQDQALFPHMTVGGNIAYGPVSSGMKRTEIERLTGSLATETGIGHLLDRGSSSLSGGEAQRAALARALAAAPECLLLDEPLSSLDSGARVEIRSLLRKLNRSGMTMLHVTHDFEEAAALATKIGIMENGTVVQVDTPQRVLSSPRTEFVARFVGIRNVYRGRLVRRQDGTSVFESASDDLFRLETLSEAEGGEATALVRSEDVILSGYRPDTSARNLFEGTVMEIIPARRGTEVTIDAGETIVSMVTEQSVESLGLERGTKVFASIKASAVRIIEG